MDNLLNILLNSNLTIYLAGLIGGFLGLVFSHKEISKIIHILRTQTSSVNAIGNVQPGENFQIVGKADGEQTLQSPITKTACVFWNVIVLEGRGTGEAAEWVTVYQKNSNQPFSIDDGTGKLTIHPERKLEFLLHDDLKIRSGIMFPMDEQEISALRDLGVEPKGDLNLTKRMYVRERFIERDDDLYVIGTKNYGDDDLAGNTPLIVSDYSERQLINRFLWQALGKTAIGVVSVALLFFFMIRR